MLAVEVEVTARLGIPEEAIKCSRRHLANSLWAMATLELLISGRLHAAVAEAM
jgi:polysaccharide pyruvyl transferase WcaK-like protein